jgi:hypothetical protein
MKCDLKNSIIQFPYQVDMKEGGLNEVSYWISNGNSISETERFSEAEELE